MNEILLNGLVTVATTAVGSFLTYIFTKKKYSAEVDNNYIKNMEDGLAAYTKLKDGILADLQASELKNDTLELENAKNREERNILNSKIDKLTLENENLKDRIEALTEENSELKTTILGLHKVVNGLSAEVKSMNRKLTNNYEARVKKNSTKA